jgi:hypothetical protein
LVKSRGILQPAKTMQVHRLLNNMHAARYANADRRCV